MAQTIDISFLVAGEVAISSRILNSPCEVFDFSITERIPLYLESSRKIFLGSLIWVVTRPIVGAASAMSWAWFSWRGHTKREGNITDRIAMTWNGLCWESTDSARHILAKLSFSFMKVPSLERCFC